MRIRHFGPQAKRVQADNLTLCPRLLHARAGRRLHIDSAQTCPHVDGAQCRVCQRGRMISGPNLDPMQLHRLLVRLDSS